MFADLRRIATMSLTVALVLGCTEDDGRAEQRVRTRLASRLCRWAHVASSARTATPVSDIHAEAARINPGFRCAASEGEPAPPSNADAANASALADDYERLADLTQGSDPGRISDDLRIRAVAWSPTPARRAGLAAWIRGVDDRARIGYVRSRAAAADAAGSALWDSLAIELARNNWILLGSGDHELVGLVSLPERWDPSRIYPILVGVEGAGCNFQEYLEACMRERGDRAVIVVVPMTLCSTNALRPAKYPFYEPATLTQFDDARWQFDGPGVDALLGEVKRLFGGADRILLAGFSGGGNYVYWRLLQAPESARGAVLSCANFENVPMAGVRDAVNGGPPVQILLGRNDPHLEFEGGDRSNPGILPETRLAEAALAKSGFRDVSRVWVDGGHRAMLDRVWTFMDEVLDEE